VNRESVVIDREAKTRAKAVAVVRAKVLKRVGAKQQRDAEEKMRQRKLERPTKDVT
jgi:hypothetical protein